MNIDSYLELPETERLKYQSHRTCPNCEGKLVREKGHSTGDLHVVCPGCHFCPDCDDGE